MTPNNLTYLSLAGMVGLYLLSNYTGYVLHIAKDGFYAPFHFLGGALTGIFVFSLTNEPFLSVMITLMIGVLWEAYEQVFWRLFIKKKKYRPGYQDTINDLILDVVGAVVAVGFLSNQFF
jgi:VanZ family protein